MILPLVLYITYSLRFCPYSRFFILDPIQLDSDLHFRGEDADYHVDHPNMPFLDKFTISWWLKTSWIPTAESQLMAIASMILEQQTQLLIAIRGTFEINLEWRSSQRYFTSP